MKNLLSISIILLLTACSANNANEISNNKQNIAECMRENKGDEALCVSKASINKMGVQCKTVTITGSRLPQRQCTTAAQRAERKNNSKEMVDKMQRRGQPQSTQE